jgi:N-acetylglucosaminyldiphosphoundecaprenol N-acetyl-beta-D-mannosaminyltransferase
MPPSISHSLSAPPPSASKRAKIMGMTLDLLSATELVERVFGDLDDGRGGWIATPNVDIMRQCARDRELARTVGSATLRIIDGAPVEWAGKLAGQPMVDRVPGSAMPWLFGPAALQRDRAILLVGGRKGAAERATEALRHAFPGLRVGYHFPPFGFETEPTEWDALRRGIADSEAAIVFVGLGFPKQERVIEVLRRDFPHVWFVGCGAAIDFVAGIVPRAPEWVQRAGLEWSYRVMVEPRRLGKRYLVHDLPFAARMIAWALVQPRPISEQRRLAE